MVGIVKRIARSWGFRAASSPIVGQNRRRAVGGRWAVWGRRSVSVCCLVVVSGLTAHVPCAHGGASEPGGGSDVVRSAAEIEYPPFSLVDAEGKATGFSVELLRAALAAMGRDVTFRTGPWPEVRGWLERGEVDALPLVGRTPEREPLFDFTVPYMTLHGAIVVRRGATDIDELDDLRGRDVAVMAGDNAEEFLRRGERGMRIHTTSTFEQALLELARGEHDAVVMQRLVALRLLDELGLEGLRVVSRPIEAFEQEFCFAVAEGDWETLALLNEGLALVTADGTSRRLHAKWFATLQLPRSRRVVVGGDSAFPPFEFLDSDGEPAGYNVELTEALARAVGLDVEIRLGPWDEMRAALARGEVDALQGMFYSHQRDLVFDFTPAHVAAQHVGVVRADGESPPASLDECAGRRLVVQRGDIVHDTVAAEGLGDPVIPVESQEDALRAVVDGRAECALVARATALYLIEKHGWTGLDVGREALLSPEYCYAVPNGRKVLLARMSEGLKALEGSGEYRRIYDEWMGVYQPQELGFSEVLRRSAGVFGILLAVLLAVVLWVWLLRRQVAVRTAELGESEARFRRAVTEAPFPVMMHAEDGEVLALSRSWTRITGYTADELRTIEDWAERAYRGRAAEMRTVIDRTYAATAPLAEGEFEVTCKSGERRTWEFGSTGLGRLSDGRRAVISMAVDVTERKRAEQALRRSERLLRTASEVARLGGWSIDLAADRVVWSDQVAAIHEMPAGFSPTVDEGLAFSAPEFRDRITEVFTACARDGTPYDEELQIVTSTGRRVWVRTIAEAERDESGGIVGVHGAFQDITERRLLEEQLLQAQKMESIGRLAGGVAHDYNNMLTVIIGKAEMACSRLGSDHPVRGDVDEILAAARRSAEITRQLLGFARKQTIAPRPLDINETVGEMSSVLERLIGEDIDLVWRPGDDIGRVLLDPTQIDQMLTNLCVNARDAIAGVGKITIETADVTIDEAYCGTHAGFIPGDFVMLAVSDDGCGMDADTVAKAFEPFFTTKRRGQGTGLGLATVYGIVKQNKGFVNVYSEPGEGTTVKIYLPRLTEETSTDAPAEVASTDEPEPGSGERVLVVEDDPAILSVMRDMLEGLGYGVVAADGPLEAVRLADDAPDDLRLLITDVVMPEMDGAALAERLIRRHPGLKVLFLSGYTANVIAHRGVLEAGVHFLQKPFTITDLSAKVRQVLAEE